MDDATKVETGADGAIVRIGKTLDRFDAIDTGLFRATPALAEAIGAGGGSLSEGVQRLADRGEATTLDVTGLLLARRRRSRGAGQGRGDARALMRAGPRRGVGVAEDAGEPPAVRGQRPELGEAGAADELLRAVALPLVEQMLAILDRAVAGDRDGR